MTSRSSLSVAVAAVVLLGPAAAARAQSGVTIDPDSPAGREYALPLDTARSGGGASKADRGNAKAPPADGDEHRELFGAGVGDGRARDDGALEPGPTTARPAATTDREREARATTRRPAATAPAPAAEAVTTTAAPASVDASSGGGSGVVPAIATGVLLLGALAGLFLRARARRTPDAAPR